VPKKHVLRELYLYINGIRVGILHRESTGRLRFTYDADWLNFKNTRPISLSLPLTEAPYVGQVVENFFDNLLPDNDRIRQRIQARFGASSSQCFDLLSYIGADCVGALQLLSYPSVSNIKKIQSISISNRDIGTLLKHYQTAPLGMDRNSDFRISITGAQEKTALLWHEKKWQLPHAATPTSHIIKLPIGKIKHTSMDLSDSVENEWLCLAILDAYGVPTNKAKIVFFDDVKTLVVERFDRRWAENNKWLMRLPQEDFCQALGISSALKYESDGGPGIADIMQLLLGSKNPNNDRRQFMKTQFLFWVMAAIDGHAKNFSITIELQGRYQLTPVYDVMSAYPLVAKRELEWKKLKLAMALQSKNKHFLCHMIQLRHWIAMANGCRFSESIMQEIMDEVFDNMDTVINAVKNKLPKNFPASISEPIFNGMLQMKNSRKK